MGVDLLDEDGFRLLKSTRYISSRQRKGGMPCSWMQKHTCTFALQSEVIAAILGPDTPGGFNSSIDCKMLSSSATAEDMMDESENETERRRISG